MENERLKNIEKYLFEIVTYMRISILIGIISVVYLIYTINASGEGVSNALSVGPKDSVLPIILVIVFFWVGVYLLFKPKNNRKD